MVLLKLIFISTTKTVILRFTRKLLGILNYSFVLFPSRFRPVIVKEAIHHILVENLQGKSYNGEEATEWTKQISDAIKTKLKGDYTINNLLHYDFLYAHVIYLKIRSCA